MRLCEVATQVRVMDGERPYFYWVTVANPEKAVAAAIKKHRTLMGLMPGQGELTATPLKS